MPPACLIFDDAALTPLLLLAPALSRKRARVLFSDYFYAQFFFFFAISARTPSRYGGVQRACRCYRCWSYTAQVAVCSVCYDTPRGEKSVRAAYKSTQRCRRVRSPRVASVLRCRRSALSNARCAPQRRVTRAAMIAARAQARCGGGAVCVACRQCRQVRRVYAPRARSRQMRQRAMRFMPFC